MKKLFLYIAMAAALSFAACNGSHKTGGDQPDSGATNAGSSGATDSAAISAGSGSPQAVGTSGTDTSGNGKGTTNPTSDTLKTNPK
ncbi:hypothetical protein GWR56_04630 [Mucilaginibacter sp. 14171R-50]|uniref:hypothetical protein n=1 Tax=Mucilaginibacter sp. 14171R-50 TaxID=2703789 RepID=UPI00138B6964|nr:hypothetical protein [Mucilaginibacter sp. 14171R-50]QHS54867.1 hypothetical protein GWR56_04630 [Mucilaginibacter sp. 14171R-50]